MKCKFCQSQLKGTERFCGVCGKPCSLIDDDKSTTQTPLRPEDSSTFDCSLPLTIAPPKTSVPVSTPPARTPYSVPTTTSHDSGRVPPVNNSRETKGVTPVKPVHQVCQPKLTNINPKEYALILQMASQNNQPVSQPIFACTASQTYNWVRVVIPLYFNIFTTYMVISSSELVLADKTLWKGMKAVVSIPWASISMVRFVIRGGILTSDIEITFLDGKSVKIPNIKRKIAESIREYLRQVTPSVRIL